MYGSFVEHLGRCVYDGIYQPGHPAADEYGFRNDVKELIGPKENRPVKKEMAWNVLETNQVGTDEFARFARECSAEVLMAVNLGTGTPKEAAELVDYCNTGKGTFWSDLRRSNGTENPHGFKVWCLGNEMDGEWQINMQILLLSLLPAAPVRMR